MWRLSYGLLDGPREMVSAQVLAVFDLPFGATGTVRHVIPALGDAEAARLLDIQAPGLSGVYAADF
jgi:hypothetical protein